MRIAQMDLAQLEAHLIAAQREERDLYRMEAAEMFGVPYEQVTPEQRQVAKLEVYRFAYSNNGISVHPRTEEDH